MLMSVSGVSACCVLVFLLGLVRKEAQAQAPGGTVSHCDYLTLSKSQWQPNAAPFKIYTRSRMPRVTSQKPVEVTIGPFSQALNFFNFTDFILYATPVINPNLELEFWTGGPKTPHLGVFQLFDRYSAGAGAMNCNPRSRSDDSVGAFEDRLLGLYRKFFANNPMVMRYRPPARNQVSVLWWPTKEALAYPEIKFVANVKSMGNWFKIQSTPWKVNRPVDQWARTERMLSQFQAMQGNLRAMERRLDQPGI